MGNVALWVECLPNSARQLSLIPGITKETRRFEWSKVYKAEPSRSRVYGDDGSLGWGR